MSESEETRYLLTRLQYWNAMLEKAKSRGESDLVTSAEQLVLAYLLRVSDSREKDQARTGHHR